MCFDAKHAARVVYPSGTLKELALLRRAPVGAGTA